MEFSVLLSVYFRENPEFLTQCIDSIYNQSIQPDEVIMVEDGPLTPELDKIIEAYSLQHTNLKIIPLVKNVGLGRALNEGLKHCTHNLVARMDTDDICMPNRFEEQLKVFQNHPEIDICSSSIDEFATDYKHVISQRILPENHSEIVKYAKKRSPVNHVTVMYKRDQVLELGGYQGFPEDYNLWVRMIMAGRIFYNIPQSLVWVRFSPEVVKRRGGLKYAKEDIQVQWNFFKMGFLSFFQFLRNSIIRGSVRIVPNNLRVYIYKHFLRKGE